MSSEILEKAQPENTFYYGNCPPQNQEGFWVRGTKGRREKRQFVLPAQVGDRTEDHALQNR